MEGCQDIKMKGLKIYKEDITMERFKNLQYPDFNINLSELDFPPIVIFSPSLLRPMMVKMHLAITTAPK